MTANRGTRCISLLLVFSACGAIVPQAFGEGLEPDKNVSVRDRPRPEYDPIGVRIESFTALPSLSLSGSYNDNIFATDTNQESDSIWGVGGRLDLRSNWSQHALRLFGGISSAIYTDHPDENNTNWLAGGSFRLDVLRDLKIDFTGDYNHEHEPRQDANAPVNTVSPVAYDLGNAGVTISETFNYVKFTGSALYSAYDYADALLTNGTTLLEGFRNHKDLTVSARGDIAISQDTSLFVQFSTQKRNYDQDPPVVSVDRDSLYREVLGGTKFNITNLMQGEIGIGYFFLDNKDPTQSDRNGLAVNANVAWFATQLMTVTVGALRKSDVADLAGSTGSVDTRVFGTVDYELRRDIILSATAGYETDDFSGIDRHDKLVSAGASARWLVNRYAQFVVGYSYNDRKSSGFDFGPAFSENVVSARIRFTI